MRILTTPLFYNLTSNLRTINLNQNIPFGSNKLDRKLIEQFEQEAQQACLQLKLQLDEIRSAQEKSTFLQNKRKEFIKESEGKCQEWIHAWANKYKVHLDGWEMSLF